MSSRRALLLVVLAASWVGSARAGDEPKLPFAPWTLERIARTSLGTWHQYEFRLQDLVLGTMRIALVKLSERGFTIEGSVQSTLAQDAPPAISQTDYVRVGKSWREARHRAQPGRLSEIRPSRNDRGKLLPVAGSEGPVITSAGTFACRRYRYQGQDVWLADSLPLLGLVKLIAKARGAGPLTLTLIATGDGARPSFD